MGPDCSVFLKLEIFQNSGSFKTRGLGNFCQKAVKNGCKKFVSSSGGNAGLAAVYCAEQLQIPITVVVPHATPESVRDKMKCYGAEVIVHGNNWNDANEKAEQICDEQNATLVHPFDHPDTWEGHASMVEEVKEQLEGVVPDLVVVSIGGGGLFCGVVEGLKRVGWEKVHVLTMETEGPGGGLHACAKANAWVKLPDYERDVIDPCLVVKRICKRSFELLSQHPVVTHVVSEPTAVEACLNVAKDHRFMLQPACGVALASIYSGSIRELQREGKLPQAINTIVVIVCGGSLISIDQMKFLEEKYITKNKTV